MITRGLSHVSGCCSLRTTVAALTVVVAVALVAIGAALPLPVGVGMMGGGGALLLIGLCMVSVCKKRQTEGESSPVASARREVEGVRRALHADVDTVLADQKLSNL